MWGMYKDAYIRSYEKERERELGGVMMMMMMITLLRKDKNLTKHQFFLNAIIPDDIKASNNRSNLRK